MSYSIGNNQLQVINGDVNGALSSIGSAYEMMQKGMGKLANAPTQVSNIVQDDADARYNEAINRYSNDPEGLAKALQSGAINTANVRASTLGQTQERLKDITSSYATNYLQKRAELNNNYWDTNGKDYLNAVDMAQHGEDIRGVRNALGANAPAEALEALAKLNSQIQQNEAIEQALRKRQIDIQGSALNEERQRREDANAARAGLFEIGKVAQRTGILNDPAKTRKFYESILKGRYVDTGLGIDFDATPYLTAIMKDPVAFTQLYSLTGMGNYADHTGGPNTTQADTALKGANPSYTPALLPKEASVFTKTKGN